MRLTSLTLQGFKSFGDRSTLEFSRGVNAIVGPNGSGKSNVVEALRWATGGGRASAYRAGEKTDLIFHGAQGKRSVSYAEVELEFELSGRRRVISRSLLRDGSSKLTLDGHTSRFLDLDEHLTGSGLGRGSLAVIGQGEVGQVLMAGPEKLLEYVSEATGVARLAQRREQAESRLLAALGHLAKLSELETSLGAHVAQLAREAEQAARQTELSRERLLLRHSLAAQRREALRAEVASLTAQAEAVAGQVRAGQGALAAAQHAWREARQAEGAAESSYRTRLSEAELLRGNARVAAERLRALELQQRTLSREAEGAAASRDRLAEERAPVPPESDRAALHAAREQAAQAVAAARAALEQLEREASASALELRARQQTEAQMQKRWAAFRSTQAHLAAERGRLAARLAELAHPEADLPALEAALAERAARSAALQAGLERQRAALQAAQSAHAEARAETQARQRAAERARAAFEARRGYAQGPKHALTSGLPGVLGSVADLLRVPFEVRAAASSALGRRAEYIVTERADEAQAVIAHVRALGGWVTVLPLELLEGRRAQLSLALGQQPGVLGLLAERVEVDARYRRVLEQLLGDTTLVRTMPEALALARREKRRPRLITLQGDVLESFGALSGGQARGPVGAIGAASDLEEAEAAAHAAAERDALAAAAVAASQQALREARLEAEAAAQALGDARSALERAQQDQAVAGSLRGELEQQQAHLAQQETALSAPELPEGGAQLERLEAALQAREQSLQGTRAHLAALVTREGQARQASLLAEERWHQHAQALARWQASAQHLAALAERLGALAGQQREVEAERERAQKGVAHAEVALPTDLGALERRAREAALERERREAALEPLSQTQAEHSARLEALNLSLARREVALELAEEELRQFPHGLERVPVSLRAGRERLAEVEAALGAIGPVNHRAALGLGQERERLSTLTEQLREASTAAAELGTALEHIERETSARLDAAIHALRERFARNVAALFGADARADVAVLRTEGRPQGLSIALQPPGKQTQTLTLLSVGERTMGALAFLFSLMQGEGQQGLPIAILDEVDAPLDEANIRRFCSFLEALARQGTQFVLITHQKATFEVADVLWGVTSDQGVSRVFSIRREMVEV